MTEQITTPEQLILEVQNLKKQLTELQSGSKKEVKPHLVDEMLDCPDCKHKLRNFMRHEKEKDHDIMSTLLGDDDGDLDDEGEDDLLEADDDDGEL